MIGRASRARAPKKKQTLLRRTDWWKVLVGFAVGTAAWNVLERLL